MKGAINQTACMHRLTCFFSVDIKQFFFHDVVNLILK